MCTFVGVGVGVGVGCQTARLHTIHSSRVQPGGHKGTQTHTHTAHMLQRTHARTRTCRRAHIHVCVRLYVCTHMPPCVRTHATILLVCPWRPQGSARVIRCMMRQREKLSVNCRAVLFDEEVSGGGTSSRRGGHERVRAAPCGPLAAAARWSCCRSLWAQQQQQQQQSQVHKVLGHSNMEPCSGLGQAAAAADHEPRHQATIALSPAEGVLLLLLLLPLPQVIMSHNIDFQVPMKKACVNEIQMFCEKVPHGDARVIRCLQDNKYAKDFGKECKEEVGALQASVRMVKGGGGHERSAKQ